MVCWNRVPNPKGETAPIPIVGGPIFESTMNGKTFKSITIAFNSKVLEEMGRKGSREKCECLIELIMSFIEDNRDIELIKDYKFNNDENFYYGDLKVIVDSLLTTYNHTEDALDMNYLKEFAPIASMLPENKTIHEFTTEDLIKKTQKEEVQSHIVISGVDEKQNKNCLIEEISFKELTPDYEVLKESKNGVQNYCFKISLPNVKASNCDLKMSEVRDFILETG